MKLNQFTENSGFNDFVALITKIDKCLTKSGKDYLDIELTSKEAVMSAKKWTIEPDDEKIKVGMVVEGIASANKYNDKLTLKIETMHPVDVDPKEFKLTAIEPLDKLAIELNTYIENIKSESLRKICLDLLETFKDDFYIHPASKSNHHGEEGGLLYHTCRMMRTAIAVCDSYNKYTEVANTDYVITGILFHDIGKIKELERTPAGNGQYTKYNLLGHITIGAMKLEEYHLKGMLNDEEALLLEHIVLSHHGKLEYGSPVLPATIEAQIVHLVDEMDAFVYGFQTENLRTPKGSLSEKYVMGVKVYNSQ